MTSKEKLITRFKLGLAIQKIIKDNKGSNEENAITSLRKLAASSGVEYSIIQKISSGQKDPQFTTLISLADGFGISASEFIAHFDNESDELAQKLATVAQKKGKNKK